MRLLHTAALIASLLFRRSESLIVYLSSRNIDSMKPLILLSYCVDCPSPETEGSISYALLSKNGVREFDVVAPAVFSVPNYAELDIIYNGEQIEGRIVVVKRGINSLIEKVEKLLLYDIEGVIIIDDGKCNENFTNCGIRAGSVGEGGFAAYDDEMRWNQVTVPVVMVTQRTGERIQSLMRVKSIEMPNIGTQYVTLIDEHDDEL